LSALSVLVRFTVSVDAQPIGPRHGRTSRPTSDCRSAAWLRAMQG